MKMKKLSNVVDILIWVLLATSWLVAVYNLIKLVFGDAIAFMLTLLFAIKLISKK